MLLVEDDPGHARLVERNLRRGGLDNEIVHLSDGQSALDYVRRSRRYSPGGDGPGLLILLDLNMPVLDGFEVLRVLKGAEETRHIPIVVLTTASAVEDVDLCYRLGCNLFVSKPVDYEELAESVRRLGFVLRSIAVPAA